MNIPEANALENTYHENDGYAYMFVTEDGTGPRFSGNRDGVSSCQGADVKCEDVIALDWGIVVFTDDHGDALARYNDIELSKTIVHETGHLIGLGRHDDPTSLILDETYSGGSNDGTVEDIPSSGETWSVMSSGWQDEMTQSPFNEEYIPISIEELLTTEFNKIETVSSSP